MSHKSPSATTTIPAPVMEGVTAMLKPFGVDFPALLQQPMNQPPPAVETLKKKYLSRKEAEQYCGVSRWLLWRAANAGLIKSVKPFSNNRSGRVLYDRESIDLWLESRECVPVK